MHAQDRFDDRRDGDLVASLLYAVSVVVAVIGATWVYNVVGSVVEVVLLLAVAAVAWIWPRPSASRQTAGQDEMQASLSS